MYSHITEVGLGLISKDMIFMFLGYHVGSKFIPTDEFVYYMN